MIRPLATTALLTLASCALSPSPALTIWADHGSAVAVSVAGAPPLEVIATGRVRVDWTPGAGEVQVTPEQDACAVVLWGDMTLADTCR